MTRNAFAMKLRNGCAAEYKRRHDQIWPDLQRELTKAGILDYSIFLDEASHTLFAVQMLHEGHTADQLPGTPIVRKWWDYMADIMETNPDKSPVCIPLREVFHMD